MKSRQRSHVSAKTSAPIVQPKSRASRSFQAELPTTSPQIAPSLQAQLDHAQRFPYNLGGAPVQAKLTIGAVNDPYEQEADRVAAQVVDQLHAPSQSSSEGRSPSVQRQEMPEEEELQMKPLANGIQRQEMPEEEELQMKSGQPSTTADSMAAGEELETQINQARGSGSPLPDPVRQPMEEQFGADFSSVRVHADSHSDQLSQSIQAKAFTTGQDIFFKSGAYTPHTKGGQELLAHELTHVVQQNGAAVQKREYPN